MVRSCYRTTIRPYRDSDKTVEIVWYFVDEDTPMLPYVHSFLSRNWDDREEDRPLGETTDRTVYSKGFNAWGAASPPPLGLADWWLNGIPTDVGCLVPVWDWCLEWELAFTTIPDAGVSFDIEEVPARLDDAALVLGAEEVPARLDDAGLVLGVEHVPADVQDAGLVLGADYSPKNQPIVIPCMVTPVPYTLYARFADLDPDCSILSGLVFVLNYDATHGNWGGDLSVSGHTLKVTFTCNPTYYAKLLSALFVDDSGAVQLNRDGLDVDTFPFKFLKPYPWGTELNALCPGNTGYSIIIDTE